MGRLLRAAGYTVSTFGSGAALLAVISEAPPQCILLDYRMPEIDGIGVQAKLAECGCKIPVILMSSELDAELVRRSFDLGAISYLEKPLQSDLLLGTVDRALAG